MTVFRLPVRRGPQAALVPRRASAFAAVLGAILFAARAARAADEPAPVKPATPSTPAVGHPSRPATPSNRTRKRRSDEGWPARISRDAALAARLMAKGMPELLEEALEGRPGVTRVLVARAYAAASRLAGRAGPQREGDLKRAEDHYRAALEAATDPAWLAEPRQRFAALRWKVELAELIIHERCAAELGRFDALRDRQPASPEFARMLDTAITECIEAEAGLGEFIDLRRRDPDAVAALGLDEALHEASRAASLSMAWALTYRAAIAPSDDPRRSARFGEALRRFEGLTRTGRRTDERMRASIGAAVTFRHSGRADEAVKLLDGLLARERSSDARDPCPPALLARARYERARAASALRRPESEEQSRRTATAAGPRSLPDASPAGERAINRVGRRPWTANAASPGTANAREGTPPLSRPLHAGIARETHKDRKVVAERLLAERKFEEAATAFRAILDRPSPGDAADREALRFNLAICLSHGPDPRGAVEIFLQLAERSADADIARRAAEQALAAARGAALRGGQPQDFDELARVCGSLSGRGRTAANEEIAWTCAWALERAGRPAQAAEAYGRVPESSPRGWAARYNAIRCRHQSLVREPERLEPDQVLTQLSAIVRDWDRLSEELGRQAALDGTRHDDLMDLRHLSLLGSAELLAGQGLRRPSEALRRLEALDQRRLTDSLLERVSLLRIACLADLGNAGGLAAAVTAYAGGSRDGESIDALRWVAGRVETEVQRLVAADPLLPPVVQGGAEGSERETGRTAEVRRLASAGVPVMHRVAARLSGDPARAAEAAAARFGVARMLLYAGQAVEARALFEELTQADPANSAYRRCLRQCDEQLARASGATEADRRRAERAWAQTLADPRLRDHAPEQYWEARYHWLRWQFDAGRRAEVARGIEAERAWFPDLGGPPWRERLLALIRECGASTAGSAGFPLPLSRE